MGACVVNLVLLQLCKKQVSCRYSTKENILSCFQGSLIKGKAPVALKNWKNLFGDQREASLSSLEECYVL